MNKSIQIDGDITVLTLIQLRVMARKEGIKRTRFLELCLRVSRGSRLFATSEWIREALSRRFTIYSLGAFHVFANKSQQLKFMSGDFRGYTAHEHNGFEIESCGRTREAQFKILDELWKYEAYTFLKHIRSLGM